MMCNTRGYFESCILGNSDISEKMVNFERLPKIFEMNNPKITVPFDSEPKILKFCPKWIAPHEISRISDIWEKWKTLRG